MPLGTTHRSAWAAPSRGRAASLKLASALLAMLLGPTPLAWAAPHAADHLHQRPAQPRESAWRPPGPPAQLAKEEQAALASSPAVRAHAAALAAARAKLQGAGAWPNPSVVAQLQLATDPANHMSTVGFRQALDFRGLGALRRGQAERDVRGAELGLARAQRAARLAVRQAFEALAVADEAVQGAARERVFRQGEWQRAKRRVAEGAWMAHERVDAELELAGAEARWKASLEARAVAVARLNLLAGRSPEAPLGLAEAPTSWASQAGPLAPWLAKARAQRLELAEASEAVQREALGADLARALRLSEGELDLEAGTTSVSAPTVYMAFALPVPLWNDRSGELGVAEAQRTRAEAERENQARMVALEVAEAHGDLVQLWGEWQVLQAAGLPQAEHALERAQQRLAAGAGTADERAQAEAQWLQRQAEARALRRAMWGARRRLEAAAGD